MMGLRLGLLGAIVLGLHFPGTRVAAVRVGIGVRIRVGRRVLGITRIPYCGGGGGKGIGIGIAVPLASVAATSCNISMIAAAVAAADAPKLLLSTVAPVLLWAKIEDAI